MIVRVRSWYGGRSARERLLIALMLAIALPLFAWLLVARPLALAYERALERHLEAVDRNGRVRALAQAARRQPPRPVMASSTDLGLVVAESAARAGLTLDSNSSAGAGAVIIAISSARPAVAMQWLAEFEAQGIRIEDLQMVPAGDGIVSLSARLARGIR